MLPLFFQQPLTFACHFCLSSFKIQFHVVIYVSFLLFTVYSTLFVLCFAHILIHSIYTLSIELKWSKLVTIYAFVCYVCTLSTLCFCMLWYGAMVKFFTSAIICRLNLRTMKKNNWYLMLHLAFNLKLEVSIKEAKNKF